jgi:transcriptional regulator with XRE-family HTH domain
MFAVRLRAARAIKHVTLNDVAAAVGVTSSAVSHWEIGIAYPKASHLVAVCKYLGCSLDWIMCPEPINLQDPMPARAALERT